MLAVNYAENAILKCYGMHVHALLPKYYHI